MAGLARRARRPNARAILLRAAALFESRAGDLAGLMCREAGKTLPNALGDVREAVDFLRYYAAQLGDDFANATHRAARRRRLHQPVELSRSRSSPARSPPRSPPATRSSPSRPRRRRWSPPKRCALLHEAGAPDDALIALLAGDGAVGAALTAHPEVAGVHVHRLDRGRAADQPHARGKRLGADGEPIPLIAETGGQNALIVDCSALPEQVVADVLSSAFDSAGQRCSALRVLCLQDDVADRMLAMLKAAMARTSSRPARPASSRRRPGDFAPKRSTMLTAHVATMRARGFARHAPRRSARIARADPSSRRR